MTAILVTCAGAALIVCGVAFWSVAAAVVLLGLLLTTAGLLVDFSG